MKGFPCSAVAGGFEIDVVTRSGQPTPTVVDDAEQLFDSENSRNLLKSSAQANTKYVLDPLEGEELALGAVRAVM